ncbi:MarR family winged helix-turn-helix transcriptional regulator [Nonomuraea guangzhouensis]|uniref:MarR family winged helix-turn-helix transcriptional regulator n=1 Tax=Nonomuraea guangzhouensis TaxID=1291555 RepID=A0ABW4GLB7_9ACTN|nr:MarR family winged helix-turn-helix transcriptional regulator [Nonomuraea guangzhouensis]
MTDVQWLTQREQQVWRRFVGVLTCLPGELDGQLQRDCDLTHFGYGVMVALSEKPQRAMRMSELAALVNGSQSRLSHVVARLERQGWVRRERTADDGRGYVAVLTDAGYDKLAASAPGHVEAVRSMVFEVLTPEQLGQLEEICSAILKKIRCGRDDLA